MLIQRLDREKMTRGYGIAGQCVLPWAEAQASPPFASTWCVVAPGKTARAHKHQEHEAFFITQGRGRMRVDDETAEVGPGDMIFMNPWNVHELQNLSEEDDLIFLDLCWEDMSQAVEENAAALEERPEARASKVVVWASPSPAAALAAEIHARFLAAHGIEAERPEPAAAGLRQSVAEELRAGLEKNGALEEEGGEKVFPLALYRDQLAEELRGVAMGPHLRAKVESYLRGELAPVPLGPALDRAAGSLAATGENWREALAAEGPRVVQFCDVEQGVVYAVVDRALYRAAGLEIALPAVLVATESSKLERVPGEDFVRLGLAAQFPEAEAARLDMAELEAHGRRELERWRDWLHALGRRLTEEFEGEVPGTGAWTDEQQHFFDRLQGLAGAAAEAYRAETFSPQRAAAVLGELVRSAASFGATQEHWKNAPDRYEERRTALAVEALAARVLAVTAAPLVPDFSLRLWRALGLGGEPAAGETPELVSGKAGQGEALRQIDFQLAAGVG